jgi:multiple sugar transport system ATP-binding protein
VGEPHDVYANPNNLFVAKFIGSPGMNFLDCTAARAGDGGIALKMSADGTELAIPKEVQARLGAGEYGGKPLVLGMRPEDVFLSTSRKPNHLAVEVFAIERMGSYNIVDVKFGEEITRVRTLPGVRLDIEQKVYVSFDMERIRIFDRQSEQSIMQERR